MNIAFTSAITEELSFRAEFVFVIPSIAAACHSEQSEESAFREWPQEQAAALVLLARKYPDTLERLEKVAAG